MGRTILSHEGVGRLFHLGQCENEHSAITKEPWGLVSWKKRSLHLSEATEESLRMEPAGTEPGNTQSLNQAIPEANPNWRFKSYAPFCLIRWRHFFPYHIQPKDSELKPQRSTFQTISTNNLKARPEKCWAPHNRRDSSRTRSNVYLRCWRGYAFHKELGWGVKEAKLCKFYDPLKLYGIGLMNKNQWIGAKLSG